MRKWYNVELNEEDAIKLHIFLIDNSINHELSRAYNLVHVEIELDDDEYIEVEKFFGRKVR